MDEHFNFFFFFKEHIWVSCSEMDEPRASDTEWSTLESEKQISYINPNIWNQGKWRWWTYSQGKNRDTDIENRFLDTAGEGEGGRSWESNIETYAYTLSYVK